MKNELTPQILSMYVGQKCDVDWDSGFKEETVIVHRVLSWIDEGQCVVTPHLRPLSSLTEAKAHPKNERGRNHRAVHLRHRPTQINAMTITQFNQTLSSIAIYEQARAHLVKHGQPVTEFLTTRLEWMYAEITPFLRAWVGKELR